MKSIKAIIASCFILYLVITCPVQASNPLSFELINAAGNCAVYIDNDPKAIGQDMYLYIQNNGSVPVTFQAIDTSKYHFKLEVNNLKYRYFTKATVQSIKLKPESQSTYSMKRMERKDSSFIFYFRIKNTATYTLPAQGRKLIALSGFKASSKSGPMAFLNTTISYKNVVKIANGTFSNSICIQATPGQEKIPLHAGLWGPQSILNNGYTANPLVIGLENISTNSGSASSDKIYFDTSSRIIISFPLEPHDTMPWKYPWALMTQKQFKNVPTPSIKLNGIRTQSWTAKAATNQHAWILQPSSDSYLNEGDILTVEFTSIKSHLPNGLSQLYVKYHNFPAYYDGHFAVPILKSPIYASKHRIGIDGPPIFPVNANTSLEVSTNIFGAVGFPPSNVGFSFHGYTGSGDDGLYADGVKHQYPTVGLYSDGKERLSFHAAKGPLYGNLFEIKNYTTAQAQLSMNIFYLNLPVNIFGDLKVQKNVSASKVQCGLSGIAPLVRFTFTDDIHSGLFRNKDTKYNFLTLYADTPKQIEMNDYSQITFFKSLTSAKGVYGSIGSPDSSVHASGFSFSDNKLSGLFCTNDPSLELYTNGKSAISIEPDGLVTFANPPQIVKDSLTTNDGHRSNYNGKLIYHKTLMVPDITTTTDDWAIIVVPRRGYKGCDTNRTDDVLIQLQASAVKKDKKSWTVNCQVTWNDAIEDHKPKKQNYGPIYVYECGCEVDYLLIKKQ